MKKKSLLICLLFLVFQSFSQKVINLNKEDGLYTLPCKVNGVKMKFIFDTGASQVSISLTEAMFLKKNGFLSKSDIIGKSNFKDATGSISEGIIINLKEINIEGISLINVRATVVNSLDAPLLLGQNVLKSLGRLTFDPNSATLTLLDFENEEEKHIKAEKHIEAGIYMASTENYELAIHDYSIAIKLNPNEPSAYFYRAISKKFMKDYEGAISDMTIVIKLDPNDETALINRGYFKTKLKDYQGSIADFTRAIQIKTDEPLAYFNRGLAKYNLKDFKGACEDWKKAEKLGYNNVKEMIMENCK